MPHGESKGSITPAKGATRQLRKSHEAPSKPKKKQYGLGVSAKRQN